MVIGNLGMVNHLIITEFNYLLQKNYNGNKAK